MSIIGEMRESKVPWSRGEALLCKSNYGSSSLPGTFLFGGGTVAQG